MAVLQLDSLPKGTHRKTIFRLLVQVAELDRAKIGAIEIRGRSATIEIPDSWAGRVVKALDGTRLADRNIRASVRSSGASGDPDDHFQNQLRWLEMEADAEAAQAREAASRMSPAEAERAGNSLIDLVIVDEYSGLGGRVLVRLAKRNRDLRLPWSRLGGGSPVLLSEQESRQAGHRGVVSRRDDRSIEVAFEHPIESENAAPVWRIDLSGDEVAGRRQRGALERAQLAAGDRLSVLCGVLLGERDAVFREASDITPLGAAINASQREAIAFCLAAEDVAIIHGPPGTGKTTTVVEFIRQVVARGKTVLACASSNLAVDNIFERLLAAGERAVRLGHPARVLPQLRDHTLDLMVEQHDDLRLARKLVREANVLRDKASRFTRGKPAPGAKREMREEARQLVEDARRLEAQVVREILDSATVLCATLTGLDSELLGQRTFDVAVIDEACQSTEPACWIPLLRSDKVILAGDHCQLPPTVVSTAAAREGFGISLLERLVSRHGDRISRRLTTQYRMNRRIMEFSSDRFYESSLIADESVAEHLLTDLVAVTSHELTDVALRFIDTAGAGYEEQREPDGASRLNPAEADLAMRKVRELMECGVPATEIAIITPYSAQVRHLRQSLDIAGLEIDSVDGFQGREKEAVIISLVRSNANGEIGFLADVRRMNVAITRARRKLIVIGDSATIANHPFYTDLLEYFELQQAYHTVWEEPAD